MQERRLLRVVVAHRSAEAADALLAVLRDRRFAVRHRYAANAAELRTSLDEGIWDLVLYEHGMTNPDAETAAAVLSRSGQDLALVVVADGTPGGAEPPAHEYFRLGAKDVLQRLDPAHLAFVVERELDALADRRAKRMLQLSLHECEQRCRMLSASAPQAIAYVRHGRLVYANPRFLEALRITRLEDIERKSLLDFIAGGERAAFERLCDGVVRGGAERTVVEIEVLRTDASGMRAEVELSPVSLEGEAGLQITLWPQGGQRAVRVPQSPAPAQPAASAAPPPPPVPAQEAPAIELVGATLAEEPATSVAPAPILDEHGFRVRVDAATADAVKRQRRGALLYLDVWLSGGGALDALDAVVHAEAMDMLAGALARAAGEDAALARLGDNAFGVLVLDRDLGYLESLMPHLIEAVEEAGRSVGIAMTASAGIALIAGAQVSASEVVMNAYAACRQARRAGESFAVYDPTASDMARRTGSRHLAREILQALRQDRLNLVFQPIVRLSGEPVPLYEVFLRVRTDQDETIPADIAFHTALEHGFADRLDAWVVEAAVRRLAREREAGRELNFFIKLTSSAIRDEKLLLKMHKCVKEHHLPAERLIIEITEGAVLTNRRAALAFLTGLRRLGFGTALEHCGVGINSLRLIEELDVDYLKIDASLIRELHRDPEQKSLFLRIVDLARKTGKLTIAECLEEAQSLVVLVEAKVDFAQGAYIHEPDETLEFDFSTQTF